MRFKDKRSGKTGKKSRLNTEIRKKLGITQVQLASMLNVSRAYIGMVESGRRSAGSSSNILMSKMYLQFYELETGKQASYRSLETRLFLNAEYKKLLPEMNTMERYFRNRIQELKKDLEIMKERARDTEHAIIVLTTATKHLQENGKQDRRTQKQLTDFNFIKQQAYNNLLTCWEPEQAKLHAKIEAIAGEAKALRRYRTKITREHNPFKKIRITK